jgi:hypothetical protein
MKLDDAAKIAAGLAWKQHTPCEWSAPFGKARLWVRKRAEGGSGRALFHPGITGYGFLEMFGPPASSLEQGQTYAVVQAYGVLHDLRKIVDDLDLAFRSSRIDG